MSALAPAWPTPLSAPLGALRHRGLLTTSVTALLYNWGFSTMLGHAPFPTELSELQLGFVFSGWGLLVAFFSVVAAPRRCRRGSAPPGRCRRRWSSSRSTCC
ncbi:hypothetical protein SAMN05660642_04577 [Geodermatophilus siccatus]|uniref:Uncharacterized protein n=1 Tax=Geodermatophilus siccatus TaxID=1137991 RepID=A0A1H0AG26_9ACTN|nr:hypothetical protein [Geodermatophilus siccatus]SDN32294.1 hypothetical protein SAMN05660642_04577 [Geodermatophilus siccatus]